MAAQSSNFSITKTTKEDLPLLPYGRIKEALLGKNYDLSLVFIGDKRARALNKRYRCKEYIPNVLAFPLGERAGEIFINARQADRERRKRGEPHRYFVALLFIHAIFHLKGMRHGSTMESEEQKMLSKFKIKNALE